MEYITRFSKMTNPALRRHTHTHSTQTDGPKPGHEVLKMEHSPRTIKQVKMLLRMKKMHVFFLL